MQGFIKDHRKELDSDIWLMPPLYHRVWQYLKYKVNHEEAYIPMRDGTKFHINKGQHLTSVRNIAKDVGWYEGVKWKEPNPKTVNTILEWLLKQNMISIDRGKGNRQYTLITLIKWEEYQKKMNEGNSKVTVDGEASKQSADINNNDKECLKNDKENINTIFEYWNSKGITVHRSLNQKAKSHINARLKDYSLEELLKAIDNYKIILEGDLYWWTHKYTLEKFMSPDKIVPFVDESEPFKSFMKKGGKQQHGSTSGSDEAKRLIEEYNINF